jgi:hypothetical protein
MLILIALTGCNSTATSRDIHNSTNTISNDINDSTHEVLNEVNISNNEINLKLDTIIENTLENNITLKELIFNTNMTQVPYSITGFEGGIFHINVLAFKNTNPEIDFTIIFKTHSYLDNNLKFNKNIPLAYGIIFYNITYDMYSVDTDIFLPYNDSGHKIHHFIDMYKVTETEFTKLQTIYVKQLEQPNTDVVYEINVDVTKLNNQYTNNKANDTNRRKTDFT